MNPIKQHSWHKQASVTFLLFMLFLPITEAISKIPVTVIEMSNTLQFLPKIVTIKIGETIEWNNNSLLVHTVTADPNPKGVAKPKPENVLLPSGAIPFNSGNIEPGGVFRKTFTISGKYRYFCIPHEGANMVGNIIVISP